MNAEALTAVINDVDFDPAIVERPRIRIRIRNPKHDPVDTTTGPEFLHDARYQPAERRRSLTTKVEALETRLEALPDADADGAVALLADMVETLLDDAHGLAEVLRKAWQLDAISIEYLARTTAWIQRTQDDRVTAGNA